MDTGAASSPGYRRRAEAGRQLATLPELTPAAGMLMRLLLDPDDTAVTLETAEALLSREDSAGLELLLRAAARGDEDTLNELAAAVHNHIIDHGNENLDRRCAGLLTAGESTRTAIGRRLCCHGQRMTVISCRRRITEGRPSSCGLAGGFIVSGGLRAFYAIDLGWDRFRLLSAAIQLGLGTGLFLDGLRRARRGDDGTDPWPIWLGIGGTVLGVALLIGATFPESPVWWVGPGAALTSVGAFQIRRCIAEHRSHGSP